MLIDQITKEQREREERAQQALDREWNEVDASRLLANHVLRGARAGDAPALTVLKTLDVHGSGSAAAKQALQTMIDDGGQGEHNSASRIDPTDVALANSVRRGESAIDIFKETALKLRTGRKRRFSSTTAAGREFVGNIVRMAKDAKKYSRQKLYSGERTCA